MFYAQLQKLCKEKGIKLTPLIKELKISTGSTGNWQRGALPGGEILMKFAKYFGVSTDYLLGLSEQKNNFTLIKSEENNMSENVFNPDKLKNEFAIFLKNKLEQNSQATEKAQSILSRLSNPEMGEKLIEIVKILKESQKNIEYIEKRSAELGITEDETQHITLEELFDFIKDVDDADWGIENMRIKNKESNSDIQEKNNNVSLTKDDLEKFKNDIINEVSSLLKDEIKKAVNKTE